MSDILLNVGYKEYCIQAQHFVDSYDEIAIWQEAQDMQGMC